MVDLEAIISRTDGTNQHEILHALKILVTHNVFGQLAHLNANQLVEGRMDSDDEDALVKEVRDIRQTNRILLGLEESARQLTKGIEI